MEVTLNTYVIGIALQIGIPVLIFLFSTHKFKGEVKVKLEDIENDITSIKSDIENIEKDVKNNYTTLREFGNETKNIHKRMDRGGL